MNINIGWLHFDNSRNKYQQVKLKTGDESRTVDMWMSLLTTGAVWVRPEHHFCLVTAVTWFNENVQHGNFRLNLFTIDTVIRCRLFQQSPIFASRRGVAQIDVREEIMDIWQTWDFIHSQHPLCTCTCKYIFNGPYLFRNNRS